MLLVIFLFCFVSNLEASFHIDKLVLSFNTTCNNTTINYYHDSKLNAAADVFIQTFVITNKMLLYITVNIAENKHDRHLKREILKTVIDVNKLFKGFYGNPLIKGFMRDLSDRIDALNIRMPLPMGTYGLKNVTVDTTFIPLLENTTGYVDLRLVGKVNNSRSMMFLIQSTFYGSFVRLW